MLKVCISATIKPGLADRRDPLTEAVKAFFYRKKTLKAKKMLINFTVSFQRRKVLKKAM